MDNNEPLILGSPGIDGKALWKIQNSPRALIANKFYSMATGIKNRANAFVGFALSAGQLDEILSFREVRGRALARGFWDKYAQDSGSADVGRFILNGIEVDMFLDLLAGIAVKLGYVKPGEIVTPFGKVAAADINKKEEGKRW